MVGIGMVHDLRGLGFKRDGSRTAQKTDVQIDAVESQREADQTVAGMREHAGGRSGLHRAG